MNGASNLQPSFCAAAFNAAMLSITLSSGLIGNQARDRQRQRSVDFNSTGDRHLAAAHFFATLRSPRRCHASFVPTTTTLCASCATVEPSAPR